MHFPNNPGIIEIDVQTFKLKQWIKQALKKDKELVMVDKLTIDEGGLTEE